MTHRSKTSYLAFPEPIKPLGKKQAEAFLDRLDSFRLGKSQRVHLRRLRDEALAE